MYHFHPQRHKPLQSTHAPHPFLEHLGRYKGLEDNKHLYFSKDAWNLIHEYKQDSRFKKEKGGIFLGKERDDSIEIVEATKPQEEDESRRFSFYRKSKKHQDIALNRWSNSDSTTTYLGEWHTHPQIIAKPSLIDIREWKNKLSDYQLPLVLVIIGIEKDWIGILSTNGILNEITIEV